MRRRLLVTLLVTVGLALGAFVANLVAGNSPNLGLDLQGGASVTLEPKGDVEEGALDVAVEIIRSRVDSLGVAEPEIVRQGNTVVVNLPGVNDQDRALELVSVTGQVLMRPVLQFFPGAAVTPEPGDTVVPDGTTPPEETGVPEDTTVPAETTVPEGTTAPETTVAEGPSRPLPEGVTTVPATTAPATTASTPDTTAPNPTSPDTTSPETTEPPAAQDPNDPFAQVILEDDQGGLYVLGAAFPDGAGGFLSGEVFRNDAKADILNGQWVVIVGLRSGFEGRDRWNAAAAQCYSRLESVCPTGQMAIVLDGTVVSAPVVQTPDFSDEVQITGAFSESEARDLAKILEFGAVPVEFDVPTVQTVSATLGKDSLQAAVVAGLVGVLLVLAYLFIYYRLLAVVVAGGLVVFSLIMWSVVSLLSTTSGLALTLAGVAGIIVSIGITVDSYIVFFERLKDELRSGRTLRNSAQRGFTGAWKTILIADTVSLIGAGILWYLTVGSVRGFAFFLGLATLCDMVVAYFYTRPSVLLLARSRWFQGRSVLGVTAPPSPLVTGGDR